MQEWLYWKSIHILHWYDIPFMTIFLVTLLPTCGTQTLQTLMSVHILLHHHVTCVITLKALTTHHYVTCVITLKALTTHHYVTCVITLKALTTAHVMKATRLRVMEQSCIVKVSTYIVSQIIELLSTTLDGAYMESTTYSIACMEYIIY